MEDIIIVHRGYEERGTRMYPLVIVLIMAVEIVDVLFFHGDFPLRKLLG